MQATMTTTEDARTQARDAGHQPHDVWEIGHKRRECETCGQVWPCWVMGAAIRHDHSEPGDPDHDDPCEWCQ